MISNAKIIGWQDHLYNLLYPLFESGVRWAIERWN